MISVERPRDELAAAIAAEGPYDLMVDYLWGPPAEAVFAALTHTEGAARPIRYILVGMTAGEAAALPTMTLRKAPVQLIGSWKRPPGLARGRRGRLRRPAPAGRRRRDRRRLDAVPLAHVERAWPQADGDRRVVFVP